MRKTVNEYFSRGPIDGPRVEVYPNNEAAVELITAYDHRCYRKISILGCVSDAPLRTYDAREAMERVDEALAESPEPALVVGLDAFLITRPDIERRALIEELQKRLDKRSERKVAYLLHESNIGENGFGNARYEQSGQLVFLKGEKVSYEPPTIDVIPPQWFPAKSLEGYEVVDSVAELYAKLGDYVPSGRYILLAEPGQGRINDCITFYRSPREVMKKFFQLSIELSDAAFDDLLKRSVAAGQAPEEFLVKHFGENALESKYLTVSRLLTLVDSPLWDAFVWLCLRKTDSRSYLHYVLQSHPSGGEFVRRYLYDCAISLIDEEKNAVRFGAEEIEEGVARLKRFAEERKQIANASDFKEYESYIDEFVEATRGDDKYALLFLNCEKQSEQVEILRRIALNDLNDGVPVRYRGLFKELEAYLAPCEYYPDAEVEEYFHNYRRFKICNDVSPEFIQTAYDLPMNYLAFPTRDSVLQNYANRSDAELTTFVVDAMGAEYLPLLAKYAGAWKLTVKEAGVVSANLPTSTEFNPIDKNVYHTVEVKSIDNIAHDGAVKHESHTHEENIYAVLKIFDGLFKDIQKALKPTNDYEKRFVVLTADHGSTRLAKVAYEKRRELVRDIESPNVPSDWRFRRAENGEHVPESCICGYVDGDTYFAVRGYNRFSKSGGKRNEMHGGASLEEMFVPFIVFSSDERDVMTKNMISASAKTLEKKPEPKPVAKPQMTEDPDFDI